MGAPFFYTEEIDGAARQFVLNGETSKHVSQVLRMKAGEQVLLTDGRGKLFTAELTDSNRRQCAVNILSMVEHQPAPKRISIAISLVKNTHRFEWFLEKATEIGVAEIIPLICTRTEKQHYRTERMKAILVSAMLQSQQTWLPRLHEPGRYAQFMKSEPHPAGRFVCHCIAGEPRVQLTIYRPFADSTVLIGPEGDFTIDEVELALVEGFLPVALGENRLRTETAAIVALTLLAQS
jgi:16S rRNA (uracil1498-N3)-methyltransferase